MNPPTSPPTASLSDFVTSLGPDDPLVLIGVGLIAFAISDTLARRQPGTMPVAGRTVGEWTAVLLLALEILLIAPITPPLAPALLRWVLAGSIATGVLLGSLRRERAFGRAKNSAIATVGEGVLLVDSRGRLIDANDSARSILWRTTPEAQGLRLPKALRSYARDPSFRHGSLQLPGHRVVECWFGESTGKASPRAIILRDITGMRRDENRLHRLAHYDSLTGLANRRLFIDELDAALERATEARLEVALLYVDLDRFKEINDTMGHAAGDQLLSEVSQRFREELLGGDNPGREQEPQASVYRLGGDEFAILVQTSNRKSAQVLGEKVLELIAAPMTLLDRSISASGSVGIAMFPTDGGDVESLVKHADSALYAAKDKGRNCSVFYDASMSVEADRARLIERELRGAIERGELKLHYQPKVDVRTSTVSGFEALLRWYSAELGFVSPKDFIPIAEDRGVIREIGAWCIDETCRQIRAWQDAGYAAVPVSVNVSSAQFNGEGVIGVVTEALQLHEVDPKLIQIELTESLLLSDNDTTSTSLRDLRAIGVTVALDDFGTGYSALTYLNNFPLDVVKMDRGFLRDIESSRTAAGIVAAVISMCHSLGLRVVAEGVDGFQQRELLEQMDCDEIQGFLYSPPIPSPEATRFLAVENGSRPIVAPATTTASIPRPFDWADDPEEVEDAAAVVGMRDLAEARKGGAGRTRRRVLIVEGDIALGQVALRLMRLGMDVHFAQGMEEACLYVSQEGPHINIVLVSPSADLGAASELLERVQKSSGECPALVVSGERPSRERCDEIRAAGARWALWSPFEDGEIEYVFAAVKAQQGPGAQRKIVRVPMNAMAWMRAGNRTEGAVLTSLSIKGAFVETGALVDVGRPVRLEFEFSAGRVRTFANVANLREASADGSQGPGMGVVFYDLDAETELQICEAIEERSAQYVL